MKIIGKVLFIYHSSLSLSLSLSVSSLCHYLTVELIDQEVGEVPHDRKREEWAEENEWEEEEVGILLALTHKKKIQLLGYKPHPPLLSSLAGGGGGGNGRDSGTS